MRVLITRPEREATALSAALVRRGHAPALNVPAQWQLVMDFLKAAS